MSQHCRYSKRCMDFIFYFYLNGTITICSKLKKSMVAVFTFFVPWDQVDLVLKVDVLFMKQAGLFRML